VPDRPSEKPGSDRIEVDGSSHRERIGIDADSDRQPDTGGRHRPDVYRPGHTGVVLTVYAPLGYTLLAAGRPVLALMGGTIAVALAMIPDLDMRLPGVSHRGVTHTVVFALLVGAVLGAFGWALGDTLSKPLVIRAGVSLRVDTLPATGLGAFGCALGVLTIGAHLLADVITPMGIVPFWPLSSKRYSLDIVRASNTVANVFLFCLGIGATLGVLWFAGPPR
jgi:inner membrane protein